MEGQMITVQIYNDRFQANLMAAKLEDQGVKAYIHHQDSVIADPSTFGMGKIQLKVNEQDLSKAKEILAA